MYKSKKTGIVGIIITIIILIILVIITNIDVNKFSYTENIFNKIVMPVQNGLTILKHKIAGNNIFFEDINSLKEENDKLKEENKKLEEDLRELEIIKAENATLREYNEMSEKYKEYQTVPAYIIDKNVTNLSESFVINVGTDDGVYANMPVIAGEGLVGFVLSSTKKTAKVQPIIDPASSVSSTISTSRDTVIAKGTLGDATSLKLMYIPTDGELILEDSIVTSGLGGIYPKGILVGTLKEIVDTKNITDRYAIIETAVNFSKLETVLVITNQ